MMRFRSQSLSRDTRPTKRIARSYSTLRDPSEYDHHLSTNGEIRPLCITPFEKFARDGWQLLTEIAEYLTDIDVLIGVRGSRIFRHIDEDFIYVLKDTHDSEYINSLEDNPRIPTLEVEIRKLKCTNDCDIPSSVTSVIVSTRAALVYPEGLKSYEATITNADIAGLPSTLESFKAVSGMTKQTLPNLRSMNVYEFVVYPKDVMIIKDGIGMVEGRWGMAEHLFPVLTDLSCMMLRSDVPTTVRNLTIGHEINRDNFMYLNIPDTLKCGISGDLRWLPDGIKTLNLTWVHGSGREIFEHDKFSQCTDLTLSGYRMHNLKNAPVLKTLKLLDCSIPDQIDIPSSVTHLTYRGSYNTKINIHDNIEHLSVSVIDSTSIGKFNNLRVIEMQFMEIDFQIELLPKSLKRVILSGVSHYPGDDGNWPSLDELLKVQQYRSKVDKLRKVISNRYEHMKHWDTCRCAIRSQIIDLLHIDFGTLAEYLKDPLYEKI